MNDTTYDWALSVVFWLLWILAGLVMAFIVSACWNHGVVHAFGAREIGWSHALCLWILAGFAKPILISKK